MERRESGYEERETSMMRGEERKGAERNSGGLQGLEEKKEERRAQRK